MINTTIMKLLKFDRKWFNLHPKMFKINGANIKAFNCFNRVSNTGHHWGIGLLQVGNRHLLYVGSSGFSLGFFGNHNNQFLSRIKDLVINFN